MKRLLLSLAFGLLISSGIIWAQDIWQIAYLSPSPVMIGGRSCKVGDDFKCNDSIQWTDESQVMKVLDPKSRRCLVLVAKALEGKKERRVNDYINLSKQLATQSAAYAEDYGRGSGHYIRYEDHGRIERIVPYEGMWMDEFPLQLDLCYYDAVNGTVRVETRDFRSFVDDLIITDDMVRRILSDMRGDEDDYLQLLGLYIDPLYRNIPLTIEEIRIYVSLKY